jgi:hypothetical protein
MRSIIREHKFEELCKEVHPSVPRMDEHLEAVEWALSCDPLQFPEIPGTRLRQIKTAAVGDIPGLRVLFTVEEKTCTLRWVEVDPDALDTFG